MKLTSSKWFWWVINILYVTLIYATLGVVPVIRTALNKKFGDSMYWPVYGIIAASFAAILFWLLKHREFLTGRRVMFFIALTALFFILMFRLEVVVERIHFLEYGLLSLGCFRLALFYCRDKTSYVWASLSVFMVGMVDEFIQWHLPNRVGDYGDVVTNGEAALLVQLIIALVIKPSIIDQVVSKRRWQFLVGFAGLATLSMAMFMTVVHHYGHSINAGKEMSFASVFSEVELKLLESGGSAALEIMEKSNPTKLTQYLKEAGDHFNMMKFYCEQHKVLEAAGEFQITRNFFKAGIERLQLTVTAPCMQIATSQQEGPGIHYRSPYQNQLLNRVTLREVWVLAIAFLVLLAWLGTRQPP